MKILIVSTVEPFIEGGGNYIVDWLHHALEKHGHKTVTIKIPFDSVPPTKIPSQTLALRLMDLSSYADRVIAVRPPSYAVKHPHKIVWFLHHFRGACDFTGTVYQDIENSPEGETLRGLIANADNQYLREAKKIFAISQNVASRLKKYNQLESEVLYPALGDAEKYYSYEPGDYILYVSRLALHKRQYLAVEAMKYTRTNVKLIVAGSPYEPDQLEYIKNIIRQNNLEKKVKIFGRWISDEEKRKLLARCLAVAYLPYEEDYGFVSLEAAYSKKAVITCRDSGGILELVADGVNGLVVSPGPQEIAGAFDRLYQNRPLAEKLGQAGLEKLATLNISWDRVVEKFTQ